MAAGRDSPSVSPETSGRRLEHRCAAEVAQSPQERQPVAEDHYWTLRNKPNVIPICSRPISRDPAWLPSAQLSCCLSEVFNGFQIFK